MLEIGKTNEVKFKISVNGTSATPSVRLVIEAPEAELGFSCNQSDGYWLTSVTLPEDLKAGDYPFRVEVVLNNKLFTPVKKTVTVARREEIAASIAPVPDQVLNVAETKQVASQEKSQLPAQKLTSAATIKLPTGLMHEVTKKKSAPAIKNLQPEPAKIDRKIKTAPIKIKIAEIVADSNARFDDVLRESKSYRKPGKAVMSMKIQHQLPVFLVKEEIIYE